MKECFLINSYCDTEEKVGILTDTIKSIRKFNIPICVHSNCRLKRLPDVDYLIMDKTNPICKMTDRTVRFWMNIKLDDKNLFISLHKKDYGYAVCHQLRSSLLYLYQLGFTDVHIINYDSRFEDTIFETAHNKLEDGYDSIMYQWAEDRGKQLCLCFFSLKLEKFIPIIESINYAKRI